VLCEKDICAAGRRRTVVLATDLHRLLSHTHTLRPPACRNWPVREFWVRSHWKVFLSAAARFSAFARSVLAHAPRAVTHRSTPAVQSHFHGGPQAAKGAVVRGWRCRGFPQSVRTNSRPRLRRCVHLHLSCERARGRNAGMRTRGGTPVSKPRVTSLHTSRLHVSWSARAALPPLQAVSLCCLCAEPCLRRSSADACVATSRWPCAGL
jgi:hypothetical protein